MWYLDKAGGRRSSICGGVSELFANMLVGANIRLLHGIAGKIDDVIKAFLDERLDIPQFYMPGFRQDNRRPAIGDANLEAYHSQNEIRRRYMSEDVIRVGWEKAVHIS